jgi:hypothetical protein
MDKGLGRFFYRLFGITILSLPLSFIPMLFGRDEIHWSVAFIFLFSLFFGLDWFYLNWRKYAHRHIGSAVVSSCLIALAAWFLWFDSPTDVVAMIVFVVSVTFFVVGLTQKYPRIMILLKLISVGAAYVLGNHLGGRDWAIVASAGIVTLFVTIPWLWISAQTFFMLVHESKHMEKGGIKEIHVQNAILFRGALFIVGIFVGVLSFFAVGDAVKTESARIPLSIMHVAFVIAVSSRPFWKKPVKLTDSTEQAEPTEQKEEPKELTRNERVAKDYGWSGRTHWHGDDDD